MPSSFVDAMEMYRDSVQEDSSIRPVTTDDDHDRTVAIVPMERRVELILDGITTGPRQREEAERNGGYLRVSSDFLREPYLSRFLATGVC